jgi:hypothetical protein
MNFSEPLRSIFEKSRSDRSFENAARVSTTQDPQNAC